MNARTRVLAAAALAITATATACACACGSGSGSGSGNQRIGGSVQGISIEVPGSFSVLDLTSETTAVNSIAKLGLASATVNTLVPQAKQFLQLHAALAVDDPDHLASHVLEKHPGDGRPDRPVHLTT